MPDLTATVGETVKPVIPKRPTMYGYQVLIGNTWNTTLFGSKEARDVGLRIDNVRANTVVPFTIPGDESGEQA